MFAVIGRVFAVVGQQVMASHIAVTLMLCRDEVSALALVKEVAEYVELRMCRQTAWQARGENRGRLRIILSEAALRPPVGSTTVMQDQYGHLVDLAASTVEL